MYFAELAINIEAPLANTFHYHIPRDLRATVQVGQLVEIEFGQRLAQGIILAFSDEASVAETKPIISLIDEQPVLKPWQIDLAYWLHQNYLAPLNGCLRLLLPPGLTRWADITVAINPFWDGTGLRTEAQEAIVALLREKGDLRGRQLQRLLPKKTKWKPALQQLARRDILRKGTILDPPRLKPKRIRTAELSASPSQIRQVLNQLGRKNKQADVLIALLLGNDPLPALSDVLARTGAIQKHITQLENAGMVQTFPASTILHLTGETVDDLPDTLQLALKQLPCDRTQLPVEIVKQLQTQNLVLAVDIPATLNLSISPQEATHHIFCLKNAGKYEQILDLLRVEARPIHISDIYARTNSTISHLRKLAKLDLIRFGSEEVWRDPLADRDFVPAEPPQLTHDQARIWGRIKVAMIMAQEDTEDAGKPVAPTPVLLHGVTGSGKTEIYMRAIDYALERGQRALVLVPEIALTPQTVRRFAARFPGRVAVFHSRLTDGQRFDTWRRARDNQFDIAVGPRSALFAPLDNIGVIVVDEEHDNSYKQTPPVPPPYYHARETAIALGAITGALVILGSATPDIVTYHKAQAEQYHLLELSKRVMGHRERIQSQVERLQVISQYLPVEDSDDALTIPLPPVQVVDLRQELRAGNRSIFSRALQQAVDETLERGEQIILFLNRRGTATFVICRQCGHVLRCPRCDIPLTYHRPNLALSCHQCGRHEPPRQQCPNCQSPHIKYFGLGTEELEERVRKQWHKARVVRWDRDTTAGKDKHETLLASFINREADILVGTQMIAKGLDLPFVTLVGIISADVSLGLPDYSTGERTFQVLAQVAGRAGRGLLGGRVIVQTYQPEHYAIQAAAEHDFISFYLTEIRFRTQHHLPPFRRMAKLVLADPIQQRGQEQAAELAHQLRIHARQKALGATEILGPTPPFFARVDGRYRWQIIIRSPDPRRLLTDIDIPHTWVVDIDPVSTL